MFSFVTSIIEALGAIGVGLVMFLENVFPPIPSELVMPLAGYLAAEGRLSLVAVFLFGTAGAVAGAWLWYLVGARLGEERLQHLADRYGTWLTLDGDNIARAAAWFGRHQDAAVFFGRMIPGVRTLISVPAGVAGMGQGRFLAYTTAGAAIWNAGLIAAGYVLSANYERVAHWLDPITTGILLAMVGWWAWRVIRRKILARG